MNFIQQFKNLNNLQVLLSTLFSNLTFKKRKLKRKKTLYQYFFCCCFHEKFLILEITEIINEIKRCTERVVFSFKCRKEQVQFGGIFSQPAKLCEIIKSAIKEIKFCH